MTADTCLRCGAPLPERQPGHPGRRRLYCCDPCRQRRPRKWARIATPPTAAQLAEQASAELERNLDLLEKRGAAYLADYAKRRVVAGNATPPPSFGAHPALERALRELVLDAEAAR